MGVWSESSSARKYASASEKCNNHHDDIVLNNMCSLIVKSGHCFKKVEDKWKAHFGFGGYIIVSIPCKETTLYQNTPNNIQIYCSRRGEWVHCMLRTPKTFSFRGAKGPVAINGLPHWLNVRENDILKFDAFGDEVVYQCTIVALSESLHGSTGDEMLGECENSLRICHLSNWNQSNSVRELRIWDLVESEWSLKVIIAFGEDLKKIELLH